MVKCLIRITTRVNVHLRMINHCYRDVKVRVLSLGPRMLGKALGVLPLYPILTGLPESASALTGLPESASASPLPRSTTPLPRSTTPLPDTPTGRFISTRGPWDCVDYMPPGVLWILNQPYIVNVDRMEMVLFLLMSRLLNHWAHGGPW